MASGRESRPLTRTVIFYWLPIAVYVCIIFSLSSMSNLPLPFKFPFRNFDKLLHFGEYGMLAVLLARAFGSLNRLKSWWIIVLLTFFFCGVLGAIDELYQSTIPNRDSDIFDVIADAMGGLFGGAGYRVLLGIFKRNESSSGLDESN